MKTGAVLRSPRLSQETRWIILVKAGGPKLKVVAEGAEKGVFVLFVLGGGGWVGVFGFCCNY